MIGYGHEITFMALLYTLYDKFFYILYTAKYRGWGREYCSLQYGPNTENSASIKLAYNSLGSYSIIIL